MTAPARFEALTIDAALAVSRNLRPENLADLRAGGGEFDPVAYAINRYQAGGWALMYGARPAAILGLDLDRPGVYTWWLAATPLLEQCARPLIRFGRNVVSRLLTTAETHRVQAFVLASWVEARHTARAIGLDYEGTMLRAGCYGEDFATYAATKHGRTL